MTRVAIDVGHILDKYELIEKVGQGGMAVVYRGMDRSLHREVAVKVLHDHLADYQEARDRFAREARAVAKLRHENILEIFDYSGSDSASSYIVTEFIDGQTLKELISERPLAQPESGAMIMVDVCRALAHAHGLGVLHRDVKPENIMIRRDGVIKLMDFGIAQMLDMQRLTVTGQLLGSPAYMAPEHVTGDPLDFRTDVFAVGIVLYQLTVGRLPFQGQNPHELLKRIVECKYRDPRQANPLIGRSLGRIIDRALAREPAQRFADIRDMQEALERYLTEECGMTELRRELARLFADPEGYEQALAQTLGDHLSRRGQEITPRDPVTALELFNRVLTMDPERKDVLAAIEGMSRRRRRTRLLVGLAATLLALVLVVILVSRSGRAPTLADAAAPDAAPGPLRATNVADRSASSANAHADAARMIAGMIADAGAEGARALLADAGIDARERQRDDDRPVRPRNPRARDAAMSQPPPVPGRRFVLKVAQRRSEYRVDDGRWTAVGNKAGFEVSAGAHTVEVRNPLCCQNEKYNISADQPGGDIAMTLSYLPATITPRCEKPGVSVQIDNRPAELGRPNVVIVGGALGMQEVRVTFIGERSDTHSLTVHYNEDREITCRFD